VDVEAITAGEASLGATWRRLSNVMEAELAWWPGRLFLVSRIVIACTVTMMLIMIFRMPSAALGAYYPLLISRDTTRATMRSAATIGAACAVGTAEVIVGAMLFSGSPFMHLLWVAGSLFGAFFLISTLRGYDAALAIGLVITNSIVVWDLPAPSGLRVEQTLFTLLAILLGCGITVVVEYVFAHRRASDAVLDGVRERLRMAGDMLRSYAEGGESSVSLRAELRRSAMLGTGALREMLLDSEYGPTYKATLSAALALAGRLIELTASFADAEGLRSEPDCARCAVIAANIDTIRSNLSQEKASGWADLPVDGGTCTPILAEIERNVALIAQCFMENELPSRFRLIEAEREVSWDPFVADAFTDSRHIRFAVRGALSAMACYLFYMSEGWTGLGASTATCVLTALPNTGASRHKQLMRFAGMLVGAFVLGFGSEVFILPQIDSLGAFALLFALVIGVGAWVGTSGPRIAYAGAQLVLAYDLVNLNRFTISTSLLPARDTMLGILLGVAAMWIVFDHLWPESSASLTRALFLSTMRDIARLDLAAEMAAPLQNQYLIAECDRLNRNFDQLRNLVDFAVFESFPKSAEETFVTGCVRDMQPQLRSLLLVKAGLLHHQIDSGPAGEPEVALQVQECASAVVKDVAQQIERYPGAAAWEQPEICRGLAARLRAQMDRLKDDYDADVLTELRLCKSLMDIAEHLTTTSKLQ
jgi:multidrug resistance protein MdtO